MRSVKKQLSPAANTSVTHHFALNSPYNATWTPVKTDNRTQTQMHEIAAVQRYYGINHPILSKSKKKLIEDKLKLDEQVRGQFDNRMRNDNLFAKFYNNPFSITHNAPISSMNALEEEQRKKRRAKITNERQFLHQPKSNIIQAVNELTQTDFFRPPSGIRRNASYSQLSSKMIKNASESQLRLQTSAISSKKKKEDVYEWTLQGIIGLEQKNFFTDRQQNINIFQVMRGTHRPLLTRDCLDKYYFSFNNLVDRIDSVKFPLFRDLSRIGRALVQDRPIAHHERLDHINSREMAVKYGDIRLQDLLSIASGRFNSDIAYAAANQGDVRKDFSPTSSEVSQIDILYDSRSRHQRNNCQNPLQARYEIQAYRFIDNTPEQTKFERFCARIQGSVQSDMQLRTDLIKHTIQDRRMHKKIEAAVQENIGYLANLNQRKAIPTERVISQNKVGKNRKEALQIRHLLQAIQISNREEVKIQKLLNPNPKDKKK